MAERRVMTPEIRQQLLGLLPFSNKATLEYIPAPYKMKTSTGEDVVPEDMRPTFVLWVLTRSEMDALRQSHKKMDDAALREIVASVTVGWKNLLDVAPEVPEDIPYKQDPKGGADRDVFSIVPNAVAADLAMCILRMNGLMGTEVMGLVS